MIKDAIQNFEPRGDQHELFGDGRSSEHIMKILKNYFD
jgi:UDP-N-acetylglucosamine 2-epimerase